MGNLENQRLSCVVRIKTRVILEKVIRDQWKNDIVFREQFMNSTGDKKSKSYSISLNNKWTRIYIWGNLSMEDPPQ